MNNNNNNRFSLLEDWIELTCARCGIKFNAAVEDDGDPLCARCRRIVKVEADPQRYLAHAGIPPRYMSASIDNMNLLPEKYKKLAQRWCKNPKDSLFLFGAVGSGKTYFACALARYLVFNGYSVLFASTPELLEEFRLAIADDRVSPFFAKLKTVEYLILDDLGAENTTPFALEKLYLLVDYRYRHMLPLIVTSNLQLSEISAKLHDRIASRLSEMCLVIKFPDIDLRVERKK